MNLHRVVDAELLGVGAWPLRPRIRKVRGEVLQCGCETAEIRAERVEHQLDGGLRTASVITQEDKGDVVQVLGQVPAVRGVDFGKQVGGEGGNPKL